MTEESMQACLTDIVTAYQMKLSTAEEAVEDVTGIFSTITSVKLPNSSHFRSNNV